MHHEIPVVRKALYLKEMYMGNRFLSVDGLTILLRSAGPQSTQLKWILICLSSWSHFKLLVKGKRKMVN